MATLTGKLVSQTYKALLKMIDNDILTESEKQISDGYGQGTGIFIDDNGFIRASVFKVTGGSSSQFLKADGSLDGTGYLPVGTTTSAIAEGSRLYFTQARVLSTILTGFVSTEGTVTAADSILSAINKIWWNIENGGGGGGGYVPYTGATQNLNLGTYGLISDFIQFNLAPTSIPTTAGTMAWNATDGTADLKMGGGNVTLQVGQEELVRVVNKTGANLLEANYQAVRISGAQGNRLKVALAKADLDANSADTIGLVTETINNNLEGFVTAVGLVRNIDTTGDLQTETWADGDMLYLSSATAGKITNVKPEAPQHGVRMGYVVRAHKTQGQIYVKVDNGYELDELHNVHITTPEDEDVLFYDGVEGLWINKNIYTAINATDVGKSLLGILNAEDTTPVTTKPRGIRINVDNSVDALDVGTQGYLPFYDDTDFYIDSPVFTDGDQVFIGGDDSYLSVNSKLTVVGGNLTVDDNWGIHLGLYQILFRYNVTGELRIGTGVPNDFITFFANSLERMRLSASGFLGLGVTNPASMIHAKATTAYPKIIIDNASASGGGMFSARQNGTETAMFGVSGAWLIDNSSDVAIVATRAGQGIQFYTNGSNSEKMGINSDGNVFVGQTPTYFAGATQLIVRGKTGAGFLGVQHFDTSIRGSINTFNSVFQVGTSTFHAVAVIVEDIERARFNSAGRMLLGTTTDNTVDKLQIDGSLIATSIKKTGGTSAQFLKADGSVDSTAYGTGSVTSVSASVPTGFAISGSPITTSGTLAISFASGYSLPTNVKQGNWDDAYTFVAGFPTQTGNAGKYLTTDGSTLSWGAIVSGVSSFNSRTGAVTLVGSDVINALGYTPVTNARTITINGVTQDLTANITFNTGGVTSFNTRTGAVTLSSSDVTTALGFTPVTQARTLTINGQGYDLSADRAWTITPSSGMRNVTHYTATANQTTFTITGGYTVGLLDVFLNGVRIPESDFTATNGTTVVFNEGVKALDIITAVLYTASATSGITGAGTSGKLPIWTGTSSLGDSVLAQSSGTLSSTGGLIFGTNNTPFDTAGSITRHSVVGLVLRGVTASVFDFALYSATGTALMTNPVGSNNINFNSGQVWFNGGNVGVGMSTPSQQLSVEDTILIKDTQSSVSQLLFGDAASDFAGRIFYNHGSDAMQFFVNASERMRITSDGQILVGTSLATAFTKSIVLNTTSGTSGLLFQLNGVDKGFLYSGGGDLFMGSNSNTIQLYTNGSERMRIGSDGTKYFGTFNSSRLQISSSGESMYQYTNNYYIWGIYNDSNSVSIESAFAGNIIFRTTAQFTGSNPTTTAERMRITSTGTLGVGTSSPNSAFIIGAQIANATTRNGIDIVNSYQNIGSAGYSISCYNTVTNVATFQVLGNGNTLNYNGSYGAISDLKLKEKISDANPKLDDLLKLKVRNFYFKKDSNNKQIGFIAQELEEIFPSLIESNIDRNPDGSFANTSTKTIKTSILIPIAVKAIQELNYKFETQAEKMARLETRVQQLEAK